MLTGSRRPLLSLALLLTLCSSLAGLEVYVDGALHARYSPAEIRSLSYRKSSPPSGLGITVDELAPVMTAAHQLRAVGPGVERVFRGPELGDELHKFWVLTGERGDVRLVARGEVVEGVTELHLLGEPYLPAPGRARRREPDLQVWVSWEGTNSLKAEVRRYADLHGLEITVTEVPAVDSKLLSVVRARGPVPDLVMVSAGSIVPLSSARAIQALDRGMTEGLSATARDAFVWDQRTWALPFYADVQLVFVNPELYPFDPRDGGSLADLALALETVAGRESRALLFPASWNAYSAYWLAPFQIGFGRQSIVNEDGSVTIDDEATRNALRFITSMREAGLLEIAERDVMISRFVSGSVGLMLSGSYSIPYLAELGVPFAVRPYPTVESTGRPVSPMIDYKGFAVTRQTRAPILARRLLQYLSGPGVQQRFNVALSKLPVNREARDPWAARSAFAAEMIGAESIGTPVPVHPAYAVYKNTVWSIARFIFSGQLSIDEALFQGQRVIDSTISDLIAPKEEER